MSESQDNISQEPTPTLTDICRGLTRLTDECLAVLDAQLAEVKLVADPLIRGDQPELETSDMDVLLDAYDKAVEIINILNPFFNGVEGSDLILHAYLERLSDARRYAMTCIQAAMNSPEPKSSMEESVMLDALKTLEGANARFTERVVGATTPR